MCETHSYKLKCIASQIPLHLSLKYFDCKFCVFGVELKHECRFCFFFYYWYSMFYVKNYHLVYCNKQQMYLGILWSALIFQYMHSILFSLLWECEVTKITKWGIPEKKLWVRGFFPQPLDILNFYSKWILLLLFDWTFKIPRQPY